MNIPDFKVKASRWHGLKSEPFIGTENHAIWVNVETPENKVGTSYENTGEIKAGNSNNRNKTFFICKDLTGTITGERLR